MANRTLATNEALSTSTPAKLGWKWWIDEDGMYIDGRLSEAPTFVFRRDGVFSAFTVEEMLSDRWWEALPERTVQMIESRLFPMPRLERTVAFVARSDGKRGHVLIHDSLLSEIFCGEDAAAAANQAFHSLRSTWPDAGIFSAESVEQANEVLACEDSATYVSKREIEHLRAVRAARGQIRNAVTAD